MRLNSISEGVLLGDWDSSTEKDCEMDDCADPPQFRTVKRVVVADNYMNPNMANDIAMIELAEPVQFNGILKSPNIVL